MSEAAHYKAAASDGSRGVFTGGTPPIDNRIDYITINNTHASSSDFANLTQARSQMNGLSGD